VPVPTVYILTRTSRRPAAFNSCRISVLGQETSLAKIVHVIGTDRPSDTYFSGDIVVPLDPPHRKECFYNLYVNHMMNVAHRHGPGFFMVLDDDDRFACEDAIDTIFSRPIASGNIVLWRVQFKKRLIPERAYFGKPPVKAHISGIGYMAHTSHRRIGQWTIKPHGDFMGIRGLYEHLDPIWLKSVLTKTQDGRHKGRAEQAWSK